jgi:hypothetical protein
MRLQDAIAIIGVFLASLIYRVWAKKPILPFGLNQSDFITYFASGGRRGWLRVQRCLIVAIKGGELISYPWFPFNMFFFPELMRLEYRIPLSKIVHATKLSQGLLGSRVDISWLDTKSCMITVTYVIPNIDLFLTQLKRQGVSVN